MRIVIEATAAVRQQAGVGRFARGLLAGLAALDAHNEYFLITTGKPRLSLGEHEVPTRHQWLHLPVSERLSAIAWHRLGIAPSPSVLVRGATLFFTPDYALPRGGRVPAALTVHDLSFLLLPECADASLRRYLARVVPLSIRRAAVVVAVSETTATALATVLGVQRTRIAVVPNGVDARFKPSRALASDDMPLVDSLRRQFGLAPGYLLHVGTLEPRKNLARLLQAYALLRERWRSADRTSPGHVPYLVLAGREGWLYEPIFREVARLGLSQAVRFLTRVPDAALVTLYQGASAFAFPSLYEGFGIPPLEAMACGVPVAASTGGALPEVLGDAALAFDPLDVEAMSEALERVLFDQDLRARLVARGQARASCYTWQASARAALELFDRMAA